MTGSDGTGGCPMTTTCHTCWARTDLVVALVQLGDDTTCLTLCSRCAMSWTPPQVDEHLADHLVGQHAQHRRDLVARRTREGT